MKGLVAIFLLLLAHGSSHGQGLVEPIDFYQEEAEEESPLEETPPQLMPKDESELGQL